FSVQVQIAVYVTVVFSPVNLTAERGICRFRIESRTLNVHLHRNFSYGVIGEQTAKIKRVYVNPGVIGFAIFNALVKLRLYTSRTVSRLQVQPRIEIVDFAFEKAGQ